jgi:pilus assembly protein Flp/PilA
MAAIFNRSEKSILTLQASEFAPRTLALSQSHPVPSWHSIRRIDLGDIHMLSIFRRLMKNEQGATAIEYVLIASLISVAAIVSMGKVGGKVSNVLSNVANAMN